MYSFIQKNVITREYVNRIKLKMMILYPGSRRKADDETKKLLLKKLAVSVIVITVLAAYNQKFYWLVICISAVAAVNSVQEAAAYSKQNIRLLKQLMEFISSLIFNYRYDGILEEAFLDTMSSSDSEINIHAAYINELLDRKQYEEALELYKDTTPNSYFLMFYSMCHMVKYEGDKEINGTSLFIANMDRLITDINDEIVRQERINYLFSGLFAITILPLFFIKPIEVWAESNLAELTAYYQSSTGIMISFILALLSILIFTFIKRIKYPPIADKVKSKMISLISGQNKVKELQKKLVERNYSKYIRKLMYLKRSGCIYNVREFQIKQFITSVLSVLVAVCCSLSMGIAEWKIILLALSGMAVGWFIPYFSVFTSYIYLKENLMNEISRLQAVIMMCMYQDSADVLFILNHMELNAGFFKDSLARAVDEYSGNGFESLENLKERENNKQFTRMVDGLIACDSIAVCHAFDFIDKDREYDINNWKIKEGRIISDKASLGKFAAFIPITFTIAAKLIIPFILEGLGRLSAFSQSFQNML